MKCKTEHGYRLGDKNVAKLLVGCNLSLLYKEEVYEADVVAVHQEPGGLRLVAGFCFVRNNLDQDRRERRLSSRETLNLFAAPIRAEAEVEIHSCPNKRQTSEYRKIVVRTPWAQAFATFTFTRGACGACGSRIIGSSHDPLPGK